ncbi:MAG: sulfotransferase [Oscillatoria sp. SIO1A7]|nr:sulfotransferase [Oscillatoria sp. SIO1A7]
MIVKRKQPVFVVGDARSGTTFLANLLIQHPEIGLAPESNFVTELMKEFGERAIATREDLDLALQQAYREAKFADLKIERSELFCELEPKLPLSFPEIVNAILRYYCQQEFPGRPVWGIKKGSYIFNGYQLSEFFPGAKFINIVRDGRAVFSSKKKALHSRTGQPFETDPVEAAMRWVRAIASFDELARQHPGNTREVSYEALVSNPPATMLDLFRFLEVEPDASVASQARESARSSWVPERYKHLHANVGQPPKVGRIDAWKQELTPADIKAFEIAAGGELKRKGYSLLYESAYLANLMSAKVKKWANKFQQILSK